MAKDIKPVPVTDEEDAEAALRVYINSKAMRTQLDERIESYRLGLMQWVEENGTVDDDGHTWIDVPGFPRPIKLEKRKTPVLNRERAEEWAREHGVLGKVNKKRIVIDFDESAFLGLLFEQDIDADEFYDYTYTPAFVPGKQT
jgi:hypothetical protein